MLWSGKLIAIGGLVLTSACSTGGKPEIDEGQFMSLLTSGEIAAFGFIPRSSIHRLKSHYIVETTNGEYFSYRGELPAMNLLDDPCDGCSPVQRIWVST